MPHVTRFVVTFDLFLFPIGKQLPMSFGHMAPSPYGRVALPYCGHERLPCWTTCAVVPAATLLNIGAYWAVHFMNGIGQGWL